MIDDALNEIKIIKLINNGNQNIIRCFEIIEDDDTSKIYIGIKINLYFKLVMEYGSNGTLIDFSDKTQIFSLNNNILKESQYIREIEKYSIADVKLQNNNSLHFTINSNNNHNKKNEFYTEEYLKKFIKQIANALEYCN